MKGISKLQLVLCCGAALGAFAVEPPATLLENADVKVARALEKPHLKGSFHDHKVNRVMVYLQSGHQRFEYQDGRKPEVLEWKAGQVVWSPSDGMHAGEVVSDDPFNIIEVELKKPAAAKAASNPGNPNDAVKNDALKLDGRHYKLEFENAQVRVLRMMLGAHQATPILGYSRNSLAVFLTDQEARATDSNGRAGSVTHKAGEVVWETPATQKMENVGDKPFEMLLIELKF
jgi:hypothetical protein